MKRSILSIIVIMMLTVACGDERTVVKSQPYSLPVQVWMKYPDKETLLKTGEVEVQKVETFENGLRTDCSIILKGQIDTVDTSIFQYALRVASAVDTSFQNLDRLTGVNSSEVSFYPEFYGYASYIDTHQSCMDEEVIVWRMDVQIATSMRSSFREIDPYTFEFRWSKFGTDQNVWLLLPKELVYSIIDLAAIDQQAIDLSESDKHWSNDSSVLGGYSYFEYIDENLEHSFVDPSGMKQWAQSVLPLLSRIWGGQLLLSAETEIPYTLTDTDVIKWTTVERKNSAHRKVEVQHSRTIVDVYPGLLKTGQIMVVK